MKTIVNRESQWKTMLRFHKHFDFSQSAFTKAENEKLLKLLYRYKECFNLPNTPLKATNIARYTATVNEDYRPFKAKPYRIAPL